MHKLLTTLIIITLLTACSNDDEPNNTIYEDAPNNSMPLTDIGIVDPASLDSIGIGDIESQMVLYVILDESSYSPTIKNLEEKNKRNRLSRASAVVSAPYPEKLNVMILNFNTDNFPGHAYRTTVSLYVGKDIVYTFSYITGKNAKEDVQTKVVDIMPYLKAEPGSSLVIHARGKIEFFSHTDESTLTLETPAPDSISLATKVSSPFVLTFK